MASKGIQEWGKGWPKILEAQRRIAANQPKFVHLRGGPQDVITSRYIPLALSAVSIPYALYGVWNMIWGINTSE